MTHLTVVKPNGTGPTLPQEHDATTGEAGRQSEFDEILYHITHDLRGGLRALRVLPEWVREDLISDGVVPSESVDEQLSMLANHAARLDQMLLDLRTFSRIGRLTEAPRVLDLAEEIDCAIEIAGVPAGFDISKDLAVQRLMAPQTDLQHLLTALLNNAHKHHDDEYGRVHVASDLEEGEVVLRVLDDGPGIEPRFHERIFEMMTTLRPRDEIEGSGMGLPIVRKVAGYLGGSVAIFDNPAGRGTQMVVRLPDTSSGPV